MSDLREELLGSSVNKKRIIAVALVALLLISMFAFSTVLFSFLFGTQRPYPSREKANTDYEDAELTKPPYPFDEDFWQDLLDDLNNPPDSLLDTLAEMFDGNIDDLDLGNFSESLLALLASEIEVFRVFNVSGFSTNTLDLNQMTDVLWKYESFDEYTGDGWHSNAITNIDDFYSYGDYLSKYFPDPELLRIKIPISPDIGINSMVLPALFPTPFIIDGSLSAPNLDPISPTLYKDEYNCTTIDLSFNSDEEVNMTYELFGLHLSNELEISNRAVEAHWTPSYIQNKYLKLPPTIDLYINNNPYFAYHLNEINNTILDNDDAFVVADKIRNYLLSNFVFDLYSYNSVPPGRDAIDWFCETQQGVYSDFVSAFCAFARVFGIANRFVDGFNSIGIQKTFDNDIMEDCFAIKYKNIYNWAEIYVPTDISGEGEWFQFDVFRGSVLGGNYSLKVLFDDDYYSRPDVATITAILKYEDIPFPNQTITFTDRTNGVYLGQDDTDINGEASIQYNINNSHVVGAHLIEARYSLMNVGYNITSFLGNVSVVLSSINPEEVNISETPLDRPRIQGYVYDPWNNKRVKNAEVNIKLFQYNTTSEISNAFNPSSIITDNNGDFDGFLDLNSFFVSAGNYEVQVDFDGRWIIDTPLGPQQHDNLLITNSSNRIAFNVTKALDVWFYIENLPSIDINNPIVSRGQDLNLTAKVVSVTEGPIPNKRVYFYDYSRGDIFIGTDISDPNGFASIIYHVGSFCVSGPNLLIARLGSQENYSYFILNEEPTINIISGPTPRIINRSGSGITQFNIVGEIYDSTNNSLPISYSRITLTLLRSGVNYSQYLIPFESYPYQTDSTGYFDLTFSVFSNTPPGNYTLRLDFNGTIDFLGHPYPYLFRLPFLNTSSSFANDLQIDAPVTLHFNLWINGTTADNPYNPVINRGDRLNLTAYIQYGGIAIDNGEWIYFYDATQHNQFIGAAQTTSGYAEVTYITGTNTTAGPHLIYATWNNKYNYSYFIMDAPVDITLDICPQPRVVNRSGTIGTDFLIHGFLTDDNGNPIKYGSINVYMYDGPFDVSYYLNLESGTLQLGTSGEIDLRYSVSSSTPAKNYTLIVVFNGIFIYTNPNYPQFFDLGYIPNLIDLASGNQLKVIDPYNIVIYFYIDGTPTQSFYSDGLPPEWYYRSNPINFSVFITQSGGPVSFGTVTFTDDYMGIPLGTQPLNSGYASILADTTNWHGGLHRISVQWTGSNTINITYVIINESINIFSYIDQISILRDIDNFIVSGTVRERGVFLRGLILNITLLDSSYFDVSSNYLTGTHTITINTDGSYQFSNSIDLSCPQGQYYIRVDFNGSINAPGIFLRDYMIHNSSLLIPINVIAGTYIIGNYETNIFKDVWYFGDECYVYGYLYWDNGTAMEGMEINVTIKDGNGAILVTQTWVTDENGFFNLTFTVGNWYDNTEVWVNFYSDDPDNFGVPDGLYVSSTEQEVFRQI